MGVLKVRDLKWKYKEGKEVLRGVNLEAEKGEFIGVVGPSGAGKTTLALALMGIIPQRIPGTFEGEVIVCGLNTREADVSEITKRVSIVFEDPETQFVMSTVEDEIALGLEVRGLEPYEIRERMVWSLDLVGLSKDFLERSPLELSGGEKQRVAIASALALKPELLILDEPTSDLDPIGKTEVLNVVGKLGEELDLTIIAVEHETEALARYADRIVVLVDGRVVLEGDPRRVFSKAKYLESVGVRPPEVTKITMELGLNPPAITVEEAFSKMCSFKPKATLKRRDVRRTSRGGKILLKLENVSYEYPNGVQAINEVSLEFKAGEFVAIVGPNGSGKTTLAKVACGLLKPTKGKVLIEGLDVGSLTRRILAKKIGYVYQNPDHQLFNQTVQDEIGFGLRVLGLSEKDINEKVLRMAERLGLKGLLDEHPFFLSKGERRRLALASVLVMEPDIIIVDEPTTGQDYKLNLDIMNILEDYRREGRTVIVISHAIPLVVRYATRLIVMLDGRVISDGSPYEILGDAEVVKKAHIQVPQTRRLVKMLEKTLNTKIEAYTPDEIIDYYR